jgi:hypothetical protein
MVGFMPEELVDLTYRGLKVAQKAKFVPAGGDAAFVEHEQPLPVGSRVTVVREGKPPVEARVVGVVELEAGAKSPPGMRLSWGVAKPAVAQESRDTNVMPAVIEPAESVGEGVPEAQEPHDTVVMAAVPEPVDEGADRSVPNPDESQAGGRKSKKNKRKPNGR